MLVVYKLPRFIPREGHAEADLPSLRQDVRSIASEKAKIYLEDILRSLHGLQPGSNFK